MRNFETNQEPSTVPREARPGVYTFGSMASGGRLRVPQERDHVSDDGIAGGVTISYSYNAVDEPVTTRCADVDGVRRLGYVPRRKV